MPPTEKRKRSAPRIRASNTRRTRPGEGQAVLGATSDPRAAALTDRLLLEHIAPAAVVVRSTGLIVRFYGALERYITLPTGDPTPDVISLARARLKPIVTAALQGAVRRNRRTTLEVTDFFRRGRTLRLTVIPLNNSGRIADRLWVIVFEEGAPATRGELSTPAAQLQETIEKLTETQERLARAQQDLELHVSERTRWLSLLHDVGSEINAAASWDEALHGVLRCLCQSEHWQIGYIYLPRPGKRDTIVPAISCFGDDRFGAFHELSMRQTYSRQDLLPGRVYASNEPFWASDLNALMTAMPIRAAAATSAGLRAGVAFPIAVQGEVVAVLEIFSDRDHPPSEQLTTLMHNVSDQIGRVLERERATARMADLVWREQQGLLHTLHDSLGQTLTGIGMLSAGLGQRLASADLEARNTAAEIARQAQHALDQVRQLAKNLFPVEVETDSLLLALRDLAVTTASLHKVPVRVEDGPPPPVRDGKMATELYRIAQEAVTNSVKHGRARTVTIRLDGDDAVTRLTVTDDGIGIPHPLPAVDGSGLRIMRYRAASIGGALNVERGPTGGTTVTCTVRHPPTSGGRLPHE